MKFRTVVALASLAVFGVTQIADARPHHPRRHAAKKTISRGVNTSTTDVNGDGVPDVVVAPKPKAKPKTKPTSKPSSGVTVN
jgi:hypothetical protein